MIENILTNIVLWFVQVALGAFIAAACYYLVRARFVIVRALGWLVTAFFIYRYGHGLFLSIGYVREGDWKEIVTGFINIILGLTTIACALRARLERAAQRRNEHA